MTICGACGEQDSWCGECRQCVGCVGHSEDCSEWLNQLKDFDPEDLTPEEVALLASLEEW